MLTHLVSLSLAVADRPLREAGVFLADPRRGYLETVSAIPLAVFEQIEEQLRQCRPQGRLPPIPSPMPLAGAWRAERMPGLTQVAERLSRALEAVSVDFRGYRGITGGPGDTRILFGEVAIPIGDCRILLAQAVMSGQAPEILPWLMEAEPAALAGS